MTATPNRFLHRVCFSHVREWDADRSTLPNKERNLEHLLYQHREAKGRKGKNGKKRKEGKWTCFVSSSTLPRWRGGPGVSCSRSESREPNPRGSDLPKSCRSRKDLHEQQTAVEDGSDYVWWRHHVCKVQRQTLSWITDAIGSSSKVWCTWSYSELMQIVSRFFFFKVSQKEKTKAREEKRNNRSRKKKKQQEQRRKKRRGLRGAIARERKKRERGGKRKKEQGEGREEEENGRKSKEGRGRTQGGGRRRERAKRRRKQSERKRRKRKRKHARRKNLSHRSYFLRISSSKEYFEFMARLSWLPRFTWTKFGNTKHIE